MTEMLCNKCGIAPAGVTHICPPIPGSVTFTPQMVGQTPTPTCTPLTDDAKRIHDLETRVWQLEQRLYRLENGNG